MVIKSYAIQPCVGCKDKEKKSLAGIMPAKIVKEGNRSTSSSCFGVNKHAGNITLQAVKRCYENNMMPADKSFKASEQQASVETQ